MRRIIRAGQLRGIRNVGGLHRTLPRQHLKIGVELHADGYVAYPLRLARDRVDGQGESCESARSDVHSALAFHVETFDPDALSTAADDGPVLEAYVAEVAVST